MYRNPERYFDGCSNCGDCCRVPGIFLPRELERLEIHLHLDLERLFRTYLIAELFTPRLEQAPAFIVSPVKQGDEGRRYRNLLAEDTYHRFFKKPCIFRDPTERSCTIYSAKPFGCSLLICGKMTKARPLLLNKTYYYHKWVASQGILFAVFPRLEAAYDRLQDSVMNLPREETGRSSALARANAVIRFEISTILNGEAGKADFFPLS